mmetsp:Transcript_4875/g.10748  ORF Transcript_4875/g.10748 Transcript_4875/m.10748 type:complete len:222 (-) Transcript_4875:359-1024(-)
MIATVRDALIVFLGRTVTLPVGPEQIRSRATVGVRVEVVEEANVGVQHHLRILDAVAIVVGVASRGPILFQWIAGCSRYPGSSDEFLVVSFVEYLCKFVVGYPSSAMTRELLMPPPQRMRSQQRHGIPPLQPHTFQEHPLHLPTTLRGRQPFGRPQTLLPIHPSPIKRIDQIESHVRRRPPRHGIRRCDPKVGPRQHPILIIVQSMQLGMFVPDGTQSRVR